MALTKTPIELSSTPGIVDNSNATAITIDSSERVLIGKTATGLGASGTEINPNGYIQVTEDQSPPLYLNRLSTDGSIVNFYKDGTTVGAIATWDGDLAVGQENVALKFNDGSNEILPWSVASNLNRDNAFNLGSSSSRFKDLYLSGGAFLGGTGAANKLEDYEEGTWTPVASAVTTAPTITYDSRGGGYTKVGNMVTAWCYIYSSSISGASGYPLITGLPFPIDTTDISYAGAAMGITTGVTGSFDSYIVGSYVRLWGATYASSGYITFTLTYPTAS